MTVLVIDVGNTRIKWGFHHQGEWLSLGALPRPDALRLASLWADQPLPTRVLACNVSDGYARQEIESAVHARGAQVEWVRSQARQCGVVSGYDDPMQLGADRWLGMVAARKRTSATSRACLIMSVGTAVTIDALSAWGKHLGGIILPNPALMADALERHTAGLKRQPGKVVMLPTNTADAIATGAIVALAGALARVEGVLKAEEDNGCELLVTGGGGADLRPHLHRPSLLVPNLVLEGLVVVADEVAQ